MDFGTAKRVVVEATSAEPVAVYASSCKLMAVFCSSVGLTGLPIDGEGPALPPHTVTSMVPATGPDGVLVTFTGTNFGVQGPGCAIGFGSEPGTVQTWTDTEITCIANQVSIPAGEQMSVWVVRQDGTSVQAPAMFTFTAAAPAITSVAPASGPSGTDITITGTNFGATQGAGWLAVGNDAATILTWSDTVITATAVRNIAGQDVPQTVTVSTADGQQATTSAPAFTFTAAAPAAPVITSVVPATGVDGSEVVINGTGFGVEGPNCRVSIGDEDAPIAGWTDTAITVAAVQGTALPDVAVPVEVVINDYQATGDSAEAMFTFTTVAREGSTAGKRVHANAKKGSKKTLPVAPPSRPDTDLGNPPPKERERPKVRELTMPDFPSGGGLMLTNHDGSKILVGPFAVEAGKMYVLPVLFPDGISVMNSGACDVTLIFAP